MNPDLKREIILEHYQNPHNKLLKNDNDYIKVNSHNESCIDDINLYVLINEGIIKDIAFSGEACAISTSSTSIMIANLVNKTIEEVRIYIDNFEKMVNGLEFDQDILKEAVVYDEIYKQKSRKNCALLPYVALKKALTKLKD